VTSENMCLEAVWATGTVGWG